MRSQLEEDFLRQLRTTTLPVPEREHMFAKPRRWRFDVAFPDVQLAVEINGGVWINGRHNRGAGYESDMQKMNTAMLIGWTVLQFGATAIESGDALRTTVLAYNMKAAT